MEDGAHSITGKSQGKIMAEEKKLKPMSDAGFKGMLWTFKLIDLIWKSERHFKKIPVKKGMVVVDYGC